MKQKENNQICKCGHGIEFHTGKDNWVRKSSSCHKCKCRKFEPVEDTINSNENKDDYCLDEKTEVEYNHNYRDGRPNGKDKIKVSSATEEILSAKNNWVDGGERPSFSQKLKELEELDESERTKVLMFDRVEKLFNDFIEELKERLFLHKQQHALMSRNISYNSVIDVINKLAGNSEDKGDRA